MTEKVEEQLAGTGDGGGALEERLDRARPAAQERPERGKTAPSAAERQGDAAALENDTTPRKSFFRRSLPMLLAAAAIAAAAVGGYCWWAISSQYVTTDDAYIQARFFRVNAKVPGYIADVSVTDNQSVRAGDTLAISVLRRP